MLSLVYCWPDGEKGWGGDEEIEASVNEYLWATIMNLVSAAENCICHMA